MSGLSDKASGKAKQVAGNATGDDKLKAEGQAQEIAGKAKTVFSDVVDKVAKKVDETRTKQK